MRLERHARLRPRQVIGKPVLGLPRLGGLVHDGVRRAPDRPHGQPLVIFRPSHEHALGYLSLRLLKEGQRPRVGSA